MTTEEVKALNGATVYFSYLKTPRRTRISVTEVTQDVARGCYKVLWPEGDVVVAQEPLEEIIAEMQYVVAHMDTSFTKDLMSMLRVAVSPKMQKSGHDFVGMAAVEAFVKESFDKGVVFMRRDPKGAEYYKINESLSATKENKEEQAVLFISFPKVENKTVPSITLYDFLLRVYQIRLAEKYYVDNPDFVPLLDIVRPPRGLPLVNEVPPISLAYSADTPHEEVQKPIIEAAVEAASSEKVAETTVSAEAQAEQEAPPSDPEVAPHEFDPVINEEAEERAMDTRVPANDSWFRKNWFIATTSTVVVSTVLLGSIKLIQVVNQEISPSEEVAEVRGDTSDDRIKMLASKLPKRSKQGRQEGAVLPQEASEVAYVSAPEVDAVPAKVAEVENSTVVPVKKEDKKPVVHSLRVAQATAQKPVIEKSPARLAEGSSRCDKLYTVDARDYVVTLNCAKNQVAVLLADQTSMNCYEKGTRLASGEMVCR